MNLSCSWVSKCFTSVRAVTLKLSETNVLASGTKEYVNGSNINLIWTTAVLGIRFVVIPPAHTHSFLGRHVFNTLSKLLYREK